MSWRPTKNYGPRGRRLRRKFGIAALGILVYKAAKQAYDNNQQKSKPVKRKKK